MCEPAKENVIPAELRAAIDRHVAPAHREEFLLDIVDALRTFAVRGDHARADDYVRDCIACLSMDRDQLDLT
jgi:acetylornithine deacetylase/succinyl-diaminopimelate desuccinylase-like protein